MIWNILSWQRAIVCIFLSLHTLNIVVFIFLCFVMLIHVSGNILANALFAILLFTEMFTLATTMTMTMVVVAYLACSCMFSVHNMKQMIIFGVGIIFSFDGARNWIMTSPNERYATHLHAYTSATGLRWITIQKTRQSLRLESHTLG